MSNNNQANIAENNTLLAKNNMLLAKTKNGGYEWVKARKLSAEEAEEINTLLINKLIEGMKLGISD